jgi:hypothetical protein
MIFLLTIVRVSILILPKFSSRGETLGSKILKKYSHVGILECVLLWATASRVKVQRTKFLLSTNQIARIPSPFDLWPLCEVALKFLSLHWRKIQPTHNHYQRARNRVTQSNVADQTRVTYKEGSRRRPRPTKCPDCTLFLWTLTENLALLQV